MRFGDGFRIGIQAVSSVPFLSLIPGCPFSSSPATEPFLCSLFSCPRAMNILFCVFFLSFLDVFILAHLVVPYPCIPCLFLPSAYLYFSIAPLPLSSLCSHCSFSLFFRVNGFIITVSEDFLCVLPVSSLCVCICGVSCFVCRRHRSLFGPSNCMSAQRVGSGSHAGDDLAHLPTKLSHTPYADARSACDWHRPWLQ